MPDQVISDNLKHLTQLKQKIVLLSIVLSNRLYFCLTLLGWLLQKACSICKTNIAEDTWKIVF